jgi:hypothetical protein
MKSFPTFNSTNPKKDVRVTSCKTPIEQQALKNVNNVRGSTVNRALDGSNYPG